MNGSARVYDLSLWLVCAGWYAEAAVPGSAAVAVSNVTTVAGSRHAKSRMFCFYNGVLVDSDRHHSLLRKLMDVRERKGSHRLDRLTPFLILEDQLVNHRSTPIRSFFSAHANERLVAVRDRRAFGLGTRYCRRDRSGLLDWIYRGCEIQRTGYLVALE